MDPLIAKIEKTRGVLNAMAIDKGLLHSEVQQISQELDCLIVEYILQQISDAEYSFIAEAI